MENANKIVKKDWLSTFNVVGKAKVGDFTYKIDEHSERSKWVYNALNLGIDCGEKFGNVYCELMGGYSEDGQNVIYCHGKDSSGNDDFDSRVTVDWEDRFDDEVLDSIGDMCFITVGLEKTDKGKTYYKRFLSAYDAIAYVSEHLEDGMVINVRGNIKYSMYQDKTQVRKNITNIALSSVEDESKYYARFTQSILIDKYSASLKPGNIDKDKGVMYIDGKVLDYIKEYNGVEIKGQYPFSKQFEFPMDFSNEAQCKKIMDKLFKVNKGITQITFEGEFIEGNAVIQKTWDDVPDDIKELVEIGAYSKEEAIARCAGNRDKEQRMVIKRPLIRLIGEDKTPVIQKFDSRYTEDELDMSYLFGNDSNDEGIDDNEDGNDMDWLKNL